MLIGLLKSIYCLKVVFLFKSFLVTTVINVENLRRGKVKRKKNLQQKVQRKTLLPARAFSFSAELPSSKKILIMEIEKKNNTFRFCMLLNIYTLTNFLQQNESCFFSIIF